MARIALLLTAALLSQAQSVVARLANVPRQVPRDYRHYSTCGLLRAHRIARRISDGDDVLDIGCADGRMLRDIGLFRELGRTAGVDVHKPTTLALPDLDFHLYDGRTLPFRDRSFDVVIFGYVLHYLTRPHAIDLLQQATRIARRRVIVIEDSLPALTALYRLRNRVEHARGNLLYGVPGGGRYRTAPDDQMYLTIPEWGALLSGLPGAASIDVERLDVISELVHHTLFEVTLATSASAGT